MRGLLLLSMASALLAWVHAGSAEDSPQGKADQPATRAAQDPVGISLLTGVELPGFVVRIYDEELRAEILARLMEDISEREFIIGRLEVLAWDLLEEENRPDTVRREVAAALNAHGYTYRASAEEEWTNGTIIPFASINERTGQNIVGIWARTPSVLVLGWGEVTPIEDKKPPTEGETSPPRPPVIPVRGMEALPGGLRMLDGLFMVTRTEPKEGEPLHEPGTPPGTPPLVAFLPTGDVLWRSPPEGMDLLRTATAQRTFANYWGNYRLVDDQVHVTIGPHKVAFVARREKDDVLQVPSLKLTLKPLDKCHDMRLEGAYRRAEGEPAITFGRRWSIEDEGVLGLLGEQSRNDGQTWTDSGKGPGTYRIRSNTIELKYRDGRTRRLLFYVLPEDRETKARIFIAGQAFHRVQKDP
jgi:hypothetical protein